MTVLKDKMLVKFEFSEDGLTLLDDTELFKNQWGRLRDICVSPNGKIYLATSGYSWPSQPPNEIIELHNPEYYVHINEYSTNNQLIPVKTFNLLGQAIDVNQHSGIYFVLYNNGSVSKKIKNGIN